MESYNTCRENTMSIAGDFNDQLRPAIGAERMSVGQYTLNESNKRGDWVKHWLMFQNYVAPNTMFRKKTDKQATFRATGGRDKQLDYLLVERRSMRPCTDAEANDMGSDHRSTETHFRLLLGKLRCGMIVCWGLFGIWLADLLSILLYRGHGVSGTYVLRAFFLLKATGVLNGTFDISSCMTQSRKCSLGKTVQTLCAFSAALRSSVNDEWRVSRRCEPSSKSGINPKLKISVERTYGRVLAVETKLTTLKNQWNRTHCSKKNVWSWKEARKEARSSTTTKRGKDERRLEEAPHESAS